MDVIDVLRAVVRWIHALAAVVWVGGSIFYLTVLNPALRSSSTAEARRTLELAVNRGFRDMVDLSIIALIVTGVIITFDRLSSAPVETPYFVILALKIVTAVTMFLFARDLGTRLGRRMSRSVRDEEVGEPSLAVGAQSRRGWKALLSPSRMILLLGLIAFFLSMLLVHTFESEVADL